MSERVFQIALSEALDLDEHRQTHQEAEAQNNGFRRRQLGKVHVAVNVIDIPWC